MLEFVKPSPLAPLIRTAQASWPFYARLNKSPLRLSVSKQTISTMIALKNSRAIICANHASPDDPMTIFGLSRLCKEQFAFLTAREIFKYYPSLSAIWLQWLGCYSVVRSAADVESYKTSIELLLKNRSKLVIFPEGEITHQNMHLAELEAGPEHLALAAALKLAKSGSKQPVYIIPVGLLYRYSKRITRSANSILSRAEKQLRIKRPSCMCIPHRLRACFLELIRKMAGSPDRSQPTDTTIEQQRDSVIRQYMQKVADEENVQLGDAYSSIENIHLLKNKLNAERFGHKGPFRQLKITPRRRAYYRWLKTITNIFAIGENTFDHSMSQEEVGELLGVLEWETAHRVSIRHERVCYLAIGKPLDMSEHVVEYEADKRRCIDNRKAELSSQILSLVEDLAKSHPSIVTYPICRARNREPVQAKVPGVSNGQRESVADQQEANHHKG